MSIRCHASYISRREEFNSRYLGHTDNEHEIQQESEYFIHLLSVHIYVHNHINEKTRSPDIKDITSLLSTNTPIGFSKSTIVGRGLDSLVVSKN